MSKYEKREGVPTIQEQRKFPAEKHPGKHRKHKRPYGIRLIPRVTIHINTKYPVILMARWFKQCQYDWYRTAAARNEAIACKLKKKAYDYKYYIFEKCER